MSIPVIVGIDCTIAFAKKLVEYSQNAGTSLIAFIIYLSVSMSVTMVIFIIAAFKSKSIASFIEETSAYDSKFKLENGTKLITAKFVILWLSWCVNLGAEIHASLQVFSFADGGLESGKCFGIVQFGKFTWDEILLIVVPHHLLKLGYFMVVASFGIFTDAICDRLNAVRIMWLHSVEKLMLGYDGPEKNIGSNGQNELIVTIEKTKFQELMDRLCCLRKLHALMERCLGLILFVITCSLVVQCVMIIYLNAVFFFRFQNTWAWGLLFKFFPLICTGTLAIIQLLFLVQCGHRLETTVRYIRNMQWKVCQWE